jgi:hypothetical protein
VPYPGGAGKARNVRASVKSTSPRANVSRGEGRDGGNQWNGIEYNTEGGKAERAGS